MKKTKKILSLVLVLIMCFSIVPMANLSIEANAVTFAQLNDSSVFLKQLESRTCTLCAAAMMMRRYSMLRGDSGWSTITESSIKSTAWLNGAGLYNSFSYSNSSVSAIKVANYSLPGGSSNETVIQNELKKCPEGIVLHNGNAPHAILITDYTDGVYYCADPANNITSGRIPISQASKVTINNATSYWKVTSPIVDGPTENHTHSYERAFSEALHPHKVWYSCSCGDGYYSGEENLSYTYGYEDEHPHKKTKTCWCGNEYYIGGTEIVDTCKDCNMPEKPSFSNWTNTYLENDTITFTWSATANTTHYNIWLYTKNANGEWTKYEHMTYVESGVTKDLPANEYRCVLQSYNSNYYDGSDWLYAESDFYYFSVVPNHTHSYASKVTKNATCIATGLKTFTCSCGASYTETIAKTSHNSNTTIPAVVATCTSTGLTEGKKCSVCGTVTVAQQTVAKKAHSYTATVTTQPTCTKEGIKTYKCSCGASYTEAIAKKSHTIVVVTAVSATCTNTGLTEGKKCSVCGTVTVAQQTVDATGHKDNNFDGKCDSCGVSSSTPDAPSDSTDNCSCNCHKGGISGFFFKILNFFQKLFGQNKVCACGVKH